MAKGQMRGNKEARKPKTKQEKAPSATGFAKGMVAPPAAASKKKH